MKYRNAEMKIDQLVSYINEEKINLSPAFQRGRVWTISDRRKLLKNMIEAKPIPSIFLYKEPAGARYSYNILDGKQRLESLILFIGDKRADVRIGKWRDYFFEEKNKKDQGFWLDVPDGKKAFHELPDEVVRNFREYALPTIEIDLDETTSLDEIISLFVDINQRGVRVQRFDIVKAIRKDDPLLRSVFNLLAETQRRKQDTFYRMKRNEFTAVLKRVQAIANIATSNPKIDRRWERLLEIALFTRTGKHRKPVEVLKSFMVQGKEQRKRLTAGETHQLRETFRFLRDAYKHEAIGKSRLATDQTHFYTMTKAILGGSLLKAPSEQQKQRGKQLQFKLAEFGGMLGGTISPKGKVRPRFKKYLEASTKQTTDVSRRGERERIFLEILQLL